MPTVADLRAAINRDADLTNGEYSEDVNAAMAVAQRFCSQYSFYFNETRDVTFPTVNGREWYDSSDNTNIPTLVRIDAAFVEDGSGKRTELTRRRPEEIERSSDGTASDGAPTDWTYFAQKIRLYPLPGSTIYTVRLQLSPYRLATLDLSDDSDTNAWLSEAYDLIKASAKYVLYKDTLKDAALATEALNDFRVWLTALKGETAMRIGMGRVVATDF